MSDLMALVASDAILHIVQIRKIGVKNINCILYYFYGFIDFIQNLFFSAQKVILRYKKKSNVVFVMVITNNFSL